MVEVETELFEKFLLGLVKENLADNEAQIVSKIGLSLGVFGQIVDRSQRPGEFLFEKIVSDGAAFEPGSDKIANSQSPELFLGGHAISRQDGGVCGLGGPFGKKLLHPLGDEVLVFKVDPEAVAKVLSESFFIGQEGEGPDAVGLLVNGYFGANIASALVVIDGFHQFVGQGVD